MVKTLFFSVVACATLGLFGCGKSEPVLIGFGKYKLGKTTPKDAYKCRPEGERTFCFLNPSPTIAGHKTQTDLYFSGLTDDAPLEEIKVGVWNCRASDVAGELEAKLGEASQRGDKRLLWKLPRMHVVAMVPFTKELCMVHFLDSKKAARALELFQSEAPE